MPSASHVVAWMLLVAGAARVVVALPPSFEIIEPGRYCTALGISADGQTIVGGTGAGNALPFRWERGVGFEVLATGGAGAARGVSADGSVVVGWYALGPVQNAFRWTRASGMVLLGDLAGGNEVSESVSVSSDGRVVLGTGRDDFHSYAMRWTQETEWISLGTLDDPYVASAGAALSGDGRVAATVAFQDTQVVSQAARWDEGDGMVGLGDLPGGPFISAATAINHDGSVIVGFGRRYTAANSTEPFYWRRGMDAIEILGSLPGGTPYGTATGVSADGSVIVGDGFDFDGDRTAFIWDQAHGVRRLDVVLGELGAPTGGVRLRRAMAITPDGLTIAGIARIGTGPALAFRAYLGSECPGDYDDGTRRGVPDGAVTVDDLLFYLWAYEEGNALADADDGSGRGVPDGAVTIDDLLFILAHYEAGC